MAIMTGKLTVPSVDMLSETATTAGSGLSSPCSSPRLPLEDVRCQVVVKKTFIELAESPSKRDTCRRFSRCKTDSLCAIKSDLEMYEPGRFSDDVQVQEQEQEASQESVPDIVPLQLCDTVLFVALQPPPAPMEQLPQPKPREQLKSQGEGRRPKTARTTLMMRNLPNNYTRDMLLQMLNSGGFSGLYDFVYLPFDFGRKANLGYAFVNLVSADHVDAFWSAFHGFTHWVLPTSKVCEVSWSGPHQGLKAHIERYKNSPVMHETVPDEYKPVLFSEGVQKPFPRPSRKIMPPKV